MPRFNIALKSISRYTRLITESLKLMITSEIISHQVFIGPNANSCHEAIITNKKGV